MNKLSSIIAVIIFIFALQSCKKQSNNDTKNVEIVDSLPQQKIEEIGEEIEESIPEEPNVTYPKTGNKITDFVPYVYEIQYEAEGDLNNDNLDDVALVFKHKKSNVLKRPMLILLQNEDHSYRLDKFSDITIPLEYNDYDYKLYDTENISIEKGALHINLYGGGASGTFLSTFKYLENDLILYKMETYFGGAGSHSSSLYDYEKSEVTTTETNTMQENEPTTSNTSKIKRKPHLFEKTSISDF
ncbi:hypothetical protein K6T82_08415 [Flavobacterium sp. 17A]|uniref:Lipoprotein n=1 Tax=Flavobacterium potami TaxID=2872310 RepID=A0A9X1H9T0_9FLAO|nr:hypothetical protein [Flavobacterium potami]MBZ4034787.1 hypothetical protein [Flavobacterium potami]